MSDDPAAHAWFVVSWNLPGPLMFISVFRVHVFRVMHMKAHGKILEKNHVKKTVGVTPWVSFWFFVTLILGFMGLALLLIYSLLGVMTIVMQLATIGTFALWFLLIGSTAVLYKTKVDKKMIDRIDRARRRERTLLAITSMVFLVFTLYSSIVLSIPKV